MAGSRERRVQMQLADAIARSVPGCIAAAVVGVALSLVFLLPVADSIGVTAENARQARFQLESGEIRPLGKRGGRRFEWRARTADGKEYALRSSNCAGRFEEIVGSVSVGDTLTVKLNRAGRILEMEKDGAMLLAFEESARSVLVDTVGFGLLAVFMLVCAAAMIFRAVRLARRRRLVRRATNIP